MIKFGPSGNSESFYALGYTATEQAPIYLKERNLDCFEYSFGKGVRISQEKGEKINRAFKDSGIDISVHAPYYINFANESDEKINNSINYLLQSADAARLMGAKRVIYHPASQGKLTREQAFERTLECTKRFLDVVYANGYDDIIFCPETMGKFAQIGSVEEIAQICKLDKVFIPTIDFGHLNCRMQGGLREEKDFKELLEYMISEIGIEKMKNFHTHFSKIEYTSKGEVRHLTFEDEIYGPEFLPLAKALKSLSLEPVVVCESAGTQAEDSVYMKNTYFNLK